MDNPVHHPALAKSISCVVPAYNEAGNLPQLLPMLHAMLKQTGHAFEIIVINDGSSDATATVLHGLCQQLSGVQAIHFSRNFGKEAALTAGLDMANGDAVLLMDADLQHSPELVPQMLQHWYNGAEVVYAVRENRDDESALKKLGSSLFYRVVNRNARFTLPEDAGDFRLMDRKVVLALRQLPERNRFMKGLYAWAGFRAVALPYTPQERHSGSSNFDALSLVNFAIDGVTSFSTWPLRLISITGLLSAVAAFLHGAWVVFEYFYWGHKDSGISTIVVLLLLFFGMQMVFTGVLGEYIGRIFEEVKHRPVYIVTHEDGQGLPPAPDAPEPPNRAGTNPAHTIAKCQAQNQTQSQVQNQDQGKMP